MYDLYLKRATKLHDSFNLKKKHITVCNCVIKFRTIPNWSSQAILVAATKEKAEEEEEEEDVEEEKEVEGDKETTPSPASSDTEPTRKRQKRTRFNGCYDDDAEGDQAMQVMYALSRVFQLYPIISTC